MLTVRFLDEARSSNGKISGESTLDGYVPDNHVRNRDERFAERSRTRRAGRRKFKASDFIPDGPPANYAQLMREKIDTSAADPAATDRLEASRTQGSGSPL